MTTAYGVGDAAGAAGVGPTSKLGSLDDPKSAVIADGETAGTGVPEPDALACANVHFDHPPDPFAAPEKAIAAPSVSKPPSTRTFGFTVGVGIGEGVGVGVGGGGVAPTDVGDGVGLAVGVAVGIGVADGGAVGEALAFGEGVGVGVAV